MPISNINKIAFAYALAGAFVGAALVFASGNLFRFMPGGTTASSTGIFPPATVMDQASGLVEDEQSIAVVERTTLAVATIVVSKDLSKLMPQGNPFFDQTMQAPRGMQKIGGGSGFFISSDGLIVTNKHVVDDANAEYTVITRSGKRLPAKVLARDPALDVAIIKVEGEGYPFLSFGNSDELKAGQTVLAIGNALDEFRNTVTKGIISGLHRRLVAEGYQNGEVIEEAIQTDAAINPGNSGGPLIDLHGNVVGVNTAVSLSGQLLGFALPGNLAKRDVEQIQRLGRITRPFLGVRYIIINDDLIKKNQLKVDHGVLITRGGDRSELAIVPGSPADKAKIQENDIILEVDGTPITEERTLSSLIGSKSPGDKVELKVLHQGEERTVEVTLEEYKN